MDYLSTTHPKDNLISALYQRWRSLSGGSLSSTSLIWEGEESRLSWSYEELITEIERSAGFIVSLGLEPGDVLGFQVPRGVAWLPLFLGALSQGVTVLSLNDSYTAHELAYYIEDAQAKVAFIPEDKHTTLRSTLTLRSRERLSLIDSCSLETHRNAYAPQAPLDSINADHLAVLAYTSGTTGRPKGARIRHRDIIGTLSALHESWAWSVSDRLVHTLPLFHIHGLFVAALGSLWAGAQLILLPRFDALQTLQTIAAHQATVLMGVPTHYHRYLQLSEAERPPVDSLRLVTSGSAPLSPEKFEAFQESFGVQIVERYGMTEVGIVLSASLNEERAPGSVGYPLPGVMAKICDAHNRTLAQGGVGELHISSESLFDGYHRRPEATSKCIYICELGRRWMRTGDIAHQDSSGRYWLKGRASEMIISGGLNVYPAEVENAIKATLNELREPPWISEVVVVGLPDEDWGERVEVFYTTIDHIKPLFAKIERLSEALTERLASYKRPKQWTWLAELPRNAMGKLQRFKLKG